MSSATPRRSTHRHRINRPCLSPLTTSVSVPSEQLVCGYRVARPLPESRRSGRGCRLRLTVPVTRPARRHAVCGGGPETRGGDWPARRAATGTGGGPVCLPARPPVCLVFGRSTAGGSADSRASSLDSLRAALLVSRDRPRPAAGAAAADVNKLVLQVCGKPARVCAAAVLRPPWTGRRVTASRVQGRRPRLQPCRGPRPTLPASGTNTTAGPVTRRQNDPSCHSAHRSVLRPAVCPSRRPAVYLSIHQSVNPSTRPSDGRSVRHPSGMRPSRAV